MGDEYRRINEYSLIRRVWDGTNCALWWASAAVVGPTVPFWRESAAGPDQLCPFGGLTPLGTTRWLAECSLGRLDCLVYGRAGIGQGLAVAHCQEGWVQGSESDRRCERGRLVPGCHRDKRKQKAQVA